MLEVVSRFDKKIQLALKENKLDFSNVKAVVYSNDIDEIIKNKDGIEVVGFEDDCRKYMLKRFSKNPTLKIVLRNVLLITSDAKKIVLGKCI